MASPAQRHFARLTAQQTSATAEAGEPLAGRTGYELMLAKLDADRRRLKDVKSIQRKIEVKRELLPSYADWIHGALTGGRGGQDDVLVTCMMWLVDIGEYRQALEIAAYALPHRLVLPDQFSRDISTALVDEISDGSIALQRQGLPMPLRDLQQLAEMVADVDMHDQPRAKLHKALGLALRAAGDLPSAAEHFRRALALHEGAGVKRDLADVEKAMKNTTPVEPAT